MVGVCTSRPRYSCDITLDGFIAVRYLPLRASSSCRAAEASRDAGRVGCPSSWTGGGDGVEVAVTAAVQVQYLPGPRTSPLQAVYVPSDRATDLIERGEPKHCRLSEASDPHAASTARTRGPASDCVEPHPQENFLRPSGERRQAPRACESGHAQLYCTALHCEGGLVWRPRSEVDAGRLVRRGVRAPGRCSASWCVSASATRRLSHTWPWPGSAGLGRSRASAAKSAS